MIKYNRVIKKLILFFWVVCLALFVSCQKDVKNDKFHKYLVFIQGNIFAAQKGCKEKIESSIWGTKGVFQKLAIQLIERQLKDNNLQWEIEVNFDNNEPFYKSNKDLDSFVRRPQQIPSIVHAWAQSGRSFFRNNGSNFNDITKAIDRINQVVRLHKKKSKITVLFINDMIHYTTWEFTDSGLYNFYNEFSRSQFLKNSQIKRKITETLTANGEFTILSIDPPNNGCERVWPGGLAPNLREAKEEACKIWERLFSINNNVKTHFELRASDIDDLSLIE